VGVLRDWSVGFAKADEVIKMQFWMWTHGAREPCIRCGGAHWRHLVNMIERSICCSDTALLVLLRLCFLTDLFASASEATATWRFTNFVLYCIVLYFDHLLSIWANVIAETDLLYIVL